MQRWRAVEAPVPGLDRIRLALRDYLLNTMVELGVPALILEDNALQGAHSQRILRKRDGDETRMRTLVRDGIEDGSILRVEPKIAVFMLLGAVH